MAEYRVTLDSGPRSGQMRWMETRAAPERLPDGGTLTLENRGDRPGCEALLRLPIL